MNVNDARKAYATILIVLRREREMRERVLSEPRKSAALKEVDDALTALLTLSDVVGMAIAAGLLTGDPGTVAPEQAQLIDIPEAKYP